MYLKCVLLLIILLFILKSFMLVENYDNCLDTPNIYNAQLERFKKAQNPLLLGYNPNDYIYKTLIMESDIPLPVNANYWFHEY